MNNLIFKLIKSFDWFTACTLLHISVSWRKTLVVSKSSALYKQETKISFNNNEIKSADFVFKYKITKVLEGQYWKYYFICDNAIIIALLLFGNTSYYLTLLVRLWQYQLLSDIVRYELIMSDRIWKTYR